MKNAPSFLGYSRLSAEVTAGAADHREQIDLSTEYPSTLQPPAGGPSDLSVPRHRNLLGPNQWPAEAALPGFRATFTEYMERMGGVAARFTALVAEAVGLPADAFARYFDDDPAAGRRQQHKLKVVRYPDAAELGLPEGTALQGQGVGPHKDSMLTSYLLQA